MDGGVGAGSEIQVDEREGFVEARFLGSFSLERFKRQAEAASQACHSRKRLHLLVDITNIDVTLSTVDRYELACHAVRASWGLKVALVALPTFIDPKKFGIVVAQNRGLRVDAFTDRQKAIDWLLAPDPAVPDSAPPA